MKYYSPFKATALAVVGFASLFTGLIFNTQAQVCISPPSGMLSWWSGSLNARDAKGGNDGNLKNQASVVSDGKVGQCFVFDGTADGVDLGAAVNLQLQNFTVEAWVRRANATYPSAQGNHNGAIFSAGGVGAYNFYIRSDGYLATGRNGVNEVISTARIIDTEWHHIAVTKSGNTVLFYLDGVAYTAPAYNSGGNTFSESAYIGAWVHGGIIDNSFNGRIDELAVYDHALSGGEISSIFSAGAAGKCPIAPMILTQPVAQTVTAGNRASLKVVAQGSSLSYQWYFWGSSVGADSPVLAFESTQSGNAGSYQVVVTSGAGLGSVSSDEVSLTVNSATCTTPSPSVLSWWPGNGNAVDLTAANSGNLVGQASASGSGKVGQCFSFDGNGDGVSLGTAMNLQIQDFTIETWVMLVNPSSPSAQGNHNGTIFSSGAFGAYNFYIRSDGYLASGKNAANEVKSTARITDSQWHHLAVTKSGTSLTFYLDGMMASQHNYNSGGYTFSESAYIGAWVHGGIVDNSLNGSVDELSVYSGALTADQIKDIYNASTAGKCPIAVPTITTHPISQSVNEGANVTFTVVASGSPIPTYQWKKNGVNLNGGNVSGATTTTLTLNSVSVNDVGLYTVEVRNLAGTVTSSQAALEVCHAETGTEAVVGRAFFYGNQLGRQPTVTCDFGRPVTPSEIQFSGMFQWHLYSGGDSSFCWHYPFIIKVGVLGHNGPGTPSAMLFDGDINTDPYKNCETAALNFSTPLSSATAFRYYVIGYADPGYPAPSPAQTFGLIYGCNVAIAGNAPIITCTPPPTVSIFAESNAKKPCTEGGFRVVRSGNLQGDLVVNYTLQGTGPESPSPVEGTVTVPDGQSATAITVLPDESLTGVAITIKPGNSYLVGSPNTASIAVVDDDVGVIRPGFDTIDFISVTPGHSPGESRNDDGSTSLIPIGFPIKFFGNTLHSALYINNNGNVTFDAPIEAFTPDPINNIAGGIQIIAPFWADVDTRSLESDIVRYGNQTVEGHNAFGVTWQDVGYFAEQADKKNSFQLVLIDRSDIAEGDFDIEFNYEKVEWETGDASNGSGGLGGYSARAGFFNGTDSYEFAGSAINGAFLDSNPSTGLKYHSFGTCKPGRYIFQIRNGTTRRLPPVQFAPASSSTLPANVTLSVPGHPNAVIYYTLDGSIPTRNSLRYNAALNITASTLVRAFAIEAASLDSIVSEGMYGNGTPTATSLVAWWSAQNNLEDRTGRHNGLRWFPTIGEPAFAAGKVGQGFSFDQANGGPSLIVPDAEDFKLTTSLTIEGWLNVTDATQPGVVLSRGDSTSSASSAYTIKTEPGADAAHCLLKFQIYNASAEIEASTTVGAWHHFAAILDDPSGEMRLYIDGSFASQITTATRPPADVTTDHPVVLGIGAFADGTQPLTGLVDELAVYSGALSASQVQAIYNSGVNGKLPIPLAAWVPKIQFVTPNQTVLPGQRAMFYVISDGNDLTYKWYRNGVYLGDTTSGMGINRAPFLIVDPVSLASAGTYTVLVENSHGSAIADTSLTVAQYPIVTTHPVSQTVAEGGAVTFTVAATGGSLEYQWLKDGNDISGATASTYTINPVELYHAGNYSVRIHNLAGTTFSSEAVLTVTPAVLITTQPQSQEVNVGANVTFTVVASASTTLSYQWIFNGAYVGSDSPTLTLSSVQLTDDKGTCQVLVTDANGRNAYSSVATLFVNDLVPPDIDPQPAPRSAIVGSDVTFTVSASGAVPRTYSWYRVGVANPIISGASPMLVLHNVQTTDAGDYYVKVENGYPLGAPVPAISDPAHLTVTQVPLPPVVITPANSATLPATVKLSVPGYPNAAIHYTITDGGSVPTTSSPKYSAPLTIDARKTITAFAVDESEKYLPSGLTASIIGDANSPTAQLDLFQWYQDAGSTYINVFENDLDPNEDALTFTTFVPQALHGTVNFTPGSTDLYYQPDPGFYGIDQFTYEGTDPAGNMAKATVLVFVSMSGNSAPVVQPKSAFLPVGADSVLIDVRSDATDPDSGDLVTLYAMSQPTRGNVTVNAGSGSMTYLRNSGVFGTDVYEYVAIDAKGSFVEEVVSVSNLDSDGDGMPNAWEVAKSLDPNSAGDSTVDPDNDGLPNLAEYYLRTNPSISDNPLTIPLTDEATISGEISIPLNINPEAELGIGINLIVDNATAAHGQVERSPDGSWICVLDTGFMLNGAYSLRLQYTHPESDLLKLDLSFFHAYGPPKNVQLNNPLTFDELTSVFASRLFVRAKVNVPADGYVVDLYDEQHLWVKTLSGSVVDGRIESDGWDLTDGDGNLIVNGPLQAEFSLTLNGQVQPFSIIKKFIMELFGSLPDDNFVIAYGFRFDREGPYYQERLRNFMIKSTVNTLGNPGRDDEYALLPGEFNQHDSYAFRYDFKKKKLLLETLKNGNNFYWWGHGDTSTITDWYYVHATTADQVARALGNDRKHLKANHPYRLVILKGCYTYSKAWADAFGIQYTPGETQPAPGARSPFTMADYRAIGRGPRAFVGWPVLSAAIADTPYDFEQQQRAYTLLFDNWMAGQRIDRCMEAWALWMDDRYKGNRTYGISGCIDLRRRDWEWEP